MKKKGQEKHIKNEKMETKKKMKEIEVVTSFNMVPLRPCNIGLTPSRISTCHLETVAGVSETPPETPGKSSHPGRGGVWEQCPYITTQQPQPPFSLVSFSSGALGAAVSCCAGCWFANVACAAVRGLSEILGIVE